MATYFDNLIIQAVVLGNACNANNWYTRVTSGGTFAWTGKGAQTGYATASDYYLPLSTVTAHASSKASPEADSYTTDASGVTAHAFVIDGGDTLYYSTTNVLKSNKGTLAFKWRAPLSYNKYQANFYLFYANNLVRIYYNYSDYKFYFQFYNGSDWTTAQAVTDAQSFAAAAWLKFCLQWNLESTGDTISAYIDVAATAAATYSSTWTEQSVPATMYWGSDPSGAYQSDGAFDELRIYAEELSAIQRTTLFDTIWG